MPQGHKVSQEVRDRARELRRAGLSMAEIARTLGVGERSVKSFTRGASQEATHPDGPDPALDQDPDASGPVGPGAALDVDLPAGELTEDVLTELPPLAEPPELPQRPTPAPVPELSRAKPNQALEEAVSRRSQAELDLQTEELAEYRTKKVEIERLQAEAQLARERRQNLELELVSIKASIMARRLDIPPSDGGQVVAMGESLDDLRQQLHGKEIELLESKFSAQISELKASQQPIGRSEYDLMALAVSEAAGLLRGLGADLRTYAIDGPLARQNLPPGRRTAEERARLGEELVAGLTGQPAQAPPAEPKAAVVLKARKLAVTCQACGRAFSLDLHALASQAGGEAGFVRCPACGYLLDAGPLLSGAGHSSGQDGRAWLRCHEYGDRARDGFCMPGGYADRETCLAGCPLYRP